VRRGLVGPAIRRSWAAVGGPACDSRRTGRQTPALAHPDVPVIASTGSAAAGRIVAELAAPLLKRVHLELGRYSALVALEGADVALAAIAESVGSFTHAGQMCMAASRHLVAYSSCTCSRRARAHHQFCCTEARHLPSTLVLDPTGTSVGPAADLS
jgi:benzaldehyde dehydrogenase (NAD)